DVQDLDYNQAVSDPGRYPYTRGIYETMYRGRLWTKREVCGFGSGRDTNERMRFQIANGVSGLSIITDNNGSLGIDADHPMGITDAGTQGVSVSSLADFEELFAEVPIDRVSIAFDNSGLDAFSWMALYVAYAERHGIDPAKLRGTVQNDTLHFLYCGYGDSCPVDLGLKTSVDIIEYCTHHMPLWHTGNVNFYDLREQGLDAPQEVAFGFGNAIEYTEKALERGLDIDAFSARRSFYCSAHIDLFEEVAKIRAARRMWARIMRDDFGAKAERSLQFRFGAHTAGVSLTAVQPLNNVVRVAYQALAAVLAGAQSVHCCSYDEPIGLPTETSQGLAIRTQQILAHETGVTRVSDPLGGSYYIENLTNQIEARATAILATIKEQGGMGTAIRSGWVQRQIDEALLLREDEIEKGEKTIVGVNEYRQPPETETPGGFHAAPEGQGERLAATVRKLRAERDNAAVAKALRELHAQAQLGERHNLIPAMVAAAHANATIGEMLGTVRIALGHDYDPMGVLQPPAEIAA
ncbi:MAG: methylmalonyl-CoA mutase family protein, partial [Alphaproteobacteria bacterium]|nr:methylmalonyl-CoA mutase family protein [Alphaproteobacteria bacterium]